MPPSAGLYALICATASLAGVFRSAISLVVLVVEGTRGINFLFGVIIAVVVANFVGSALGQDGVYESEIERDGNVFFLPSEPRRILSTLTAEQVRHRTRSTCKKQLRGLVYWAPDGRQIQHSPAWTTGSVW